MTRTRTSHDKPIAEELRALVLPLETMTPPLDFDALFGSTAPHAIEIGTGNGYFIESEAARLADWQFIGIEREPKFYWKMVRRVERAGLSNVRTFGGDAFDLMETWIGDGALERIYCYFSDPWPKRRHAERRVVGAHLLPILERMLVPGGAFWYKSDVGWFFNLAVTAFRTRPGWRLEEVRRIHEPGGGEGEVVTNFERKGREQGRQVWGFHAIWDGAA